MQDIQSMPDHRQIALDQAGVTGLRYPITVLDRASGKQPTVAQVTMSVSLPHHFKGTHMSRFIEVLNRHRGEVTLWTVPLIVRELRQRLNAPQARVEFRFPYFLERAAPATGAKALLDYEAWFIGAAEGGVPDVSDAQVAADATADASAGSVREDFVLGVCVPVTSLCPCSKAISDYGAHNQRGHITIEVRMAPVGDDTERMVWIEELVAIAEASASAPVYPLLKRADERFVTMQAYDNPVFVEDMVRNVAAQLRDDPRITWFKVFALNDESIHNHGAFASVTWQR
jgi:GTP cyclohydrolase I